MVITSPFHRCVQTAAAIIEVLPQRNGKKVGPFCSICQHVWTGVPNHMSRTWCSSQVPILIDAEVSEVPGPS